MTRKTILRLASAVLAALTIVVSHLYISHQPSPPASSVGLIYALILLMGGGLTGVLLYLASPPEAPPVRSEAGEKTRLRRRIKTRSS